MTLTLKDLLEAGAHFGHQTRRWNPKMKKFIFTEQNGIYIIDLQKTMKKVDEAAAKVREIVGGRKSMLFVGTKKQARDVIKEEAERCNMNFVTERWLGGMLTNYKTISQSIDRLRNLERMKEDGSYESFTKKEVGRMEKKRHKLDKILMGIRDMGNLPGLLFVVDTIKEKIAILEAKKLGIPVVGMVDTNADPDMVDFPIPANDDAIRSIKLVAHALADACLESRKKFDLEEEMKSKHIRRDSEEKQEEPEAEKTETQAEAPAPAAEAKPAERKAEEAKK